VENVKRTCGAFILLAILVVFAGCRAPESLDVRLSGDKVIGMRKGQVLNLELKANPTTGYIWDLSGLSDSGVLRRIGKYKYIRESDLIGAGGTQIFRFEARKKGQEKLTFRYGRPWEENKEPAKIYKVRIIVH